MPELKVKNGQSLWSIAESYAKKANPGATNAEIKSLSNLIAAANGLDTEAKLKDGQKLTIPDAVLDGRSAEALARLSARPTARSGGVNARLTSNTKPLVDIKAVFSDTTTKSKGEVKLLDVAGVPLKGELREFQGTKSYIGEAAQITTAATFGKLTQAQFDAVHKELGGRSNVKFDANRSYTLVDFLPPALQALVDKDLETPDLITLKGTQKIGMQGTPFDRDSDHQVGLTMNCHATAYEAVRAYQGANDKSVAVFYGEMIVMDGIAHDDKQFQVLHDVKADKAKDLLSLDLKPGDVVQFHQDNGFMRASTNLLHSAVYVGGGVFFEKPNTEGPEKDDPAKYATQDETPFRLATLDNMIKPMSEAVDGQFRIEVLRAKAPLPDAHEAFGSSLQKEFEKAAEKKGRTLGVDLVTELEQGMGGNIRGEAISALVRVPLKTGDDGIAKLG